MSHEVGAPDDGAPGGDLRAGSSLTSPASDGPTSTPSTELTDTCPRETPRTSSMPRHCRIHFASLHSSLVNLPISLYGPLVERGVVSQYSLRLRLQPCSHSSA